MRNGKIVKGIIPVLDEEASIGKVLDALPGWIDEVLVVDNGCRDRTAAVARAHGARVLTEPQRGYGAACLAGIAAMDEADIVVFVDGDYSDHPEQADRVVDPIALDRADLVIGSRVLGQPERGALTPQARAGNWLACLLMKQVWNQTYTDLGPFRAIRHDCLVALGMVDRNYGWTVEMQIKAARAGLRVCEVPVSYRRRIGKSKVSGTIRGVIGAGTKILWTILVYSLR